MNTPHSLIGKKHIVLSSFYPCEKTLQLIYYALCHDINIFILDAKSPHLKEVYPEGLNPEETLKISQFEANEMLETLGFNFKADDIKNSASIIGLFTSGSSGLPKCVCLSSKQLYESALIFSQWANINDSSIVMSFAPVSSMSGLRTFLFLPLITKVKVLPPSENANLLAMANSFFKENVTHIVCGPPLVTQLAMLAPRLSKNTFSSLKYILCTGARFPYQAAHSLAQAVNLKVLNYYGLTETYGFCIAQKIDTGRRCYEKSIGEAVSGVSLEVVDADDQGIGKLRVYSDRIFNGYWPNICKSTYFDTGDLAKVNKNGTVSLYGRADNAFKLDSTELVYPATIELMLESVLRSKSLQVFSNYSGWGINIETELDMAAIKQIINTKLGAKYLPKTINIKDKNEISPLGKMVKE